MTPTILIFTDTIGQGKTTFLKDWATNRKRIGGVVSQKINGKYYFELLPSGELVSMESTAGNLEIGKYTFDATNFKTVEKSIWNDWKNASIDTVIIDEIGPLELKKKQGFHELLLKIISHDVKHKKTLILVVRDYCVQDCIRNYNFGDVKIVTKTDLKNPKHKRPIGLVLCGGKSERMQSEKGLLNYHGMPQWRYVQQLLQPFCEAVYIALNEDQASEWLIPASVNVSIDKALYINHGPMTALLSIKDRLKDQPLFIVACDYPLLGMKELIHLMTSRNATADLTCFTKDGRPEPLITLFEVSAISKLIAYYEDGNDSIFKFIETHTAHYCVLDNTTVLQNVNSQDAMIAIKKTLNP